MADEDSTQSPPQDPPVFKHLSLKTQNYLRQANQSKAQQENQDQKFNMSSEQTLVHLYRGTIAVELTPRQSFIAIKPDGVQRGLIGDIISRFEKRGYKLVAMKLVSPSKEHLEKHYEDLADKPFYKGLVSCMSDTDAEISL